MSRRDESLTKRSGGKDSCSFAGGEKKSKAVNADYNKVIWRYSTVCYTTGGRGLPRQEGRGKNQPAWQKTYQARFRARIKVKDLGGGGVFKTKEEKNRSSMPMDDRQGKKRKSKNERRYLLRKNKLVPKR